MSARRPWAKPLVPLYRAMLQMEEALRRGGMRRTRKLGFPVISVGSLSAGGAGKTPVVIALAKLLRDDGWRVDVLSRGYGRKGRGVEQVQCTAERAAERYGDEPVLIANLADVPVWVGSSRYAAGMASESVAADAGPMLHLLDDGFQHRQLARTLDVVLITEEDLDDRLIPAGNLRESMAALSRADVVIVREDEVDTAGKRVWHLLREGAQMWTVRRVLRFPAPLFVFGAGLRPVAFCAIARPEGFAAMLQQAGCGIVETVAFSDHHRYAVADIEHIVGVARNMGGSGFVTTEKDAVKLTAEMRTRLEGHGPLMIVALEAVFADKDAVLRSITAKLSGGIRDGGVSVR